MTTYSVTPVATPDPTNFTITGTIGGVTLKWVEPTDDISYGAEIWVSTTNNRANASLVAVVTGSSFYHELSAGATRYYWIRGRDVYGRSTGNWVPSSATGGLAGTTPGVSTADIPVGAVTNTTVYSDGVTSTGVWQTGVNDGFSKNVSIVGTGNLFLITFADKLDYDISALSNNGDFFALSTSFLVMQGGTTVAGIGSNPIFVSNKDGTSWFTKFANQQPTTTLAVTLGAGITYNLVINHYRQAGGSAALSNFSVTSQNRVITVTELKR